jgi:glycerol-3-phosphate dehydrogenase
VENKVKGPVLQRTIEKLENTEFDLVIVGAGIFGVCAAWEGVARGLSVALLEKDDFCHAASSNHFKIAHGGIRYIQHGDIHRIRESSHERSALLRIAPHLVSPLPIVIPTYRHGLKGKGVLKIGTALYDLMTYDRNRELLEDKAIPAGTLMSREKVSKLFPGINRRGLTGGLVFCDGQIYSPPRLAISFLRSAGAKGLVAANYVKTDGYIRENNAICGVTATDVMSGRMLTIRGKMVLNTSGAWAYPLNKDSLNIATQPIPTFSRDLALVVDRKPEHGFGVAITTNTGDADSIIDRGGRHLFIVPWRNRTLVGVWHKIYEKQPDKIEVPEKELKAYIDEVNMIYPSLSLSVSDIVMVNTGLTLFGSKNDQGEMKLSFGKRSRIIDHQKINQLDGLLTVIGVRATMARGMAEKAVSLVFKRLGRAPSASMTSYTPIYGGKFDSYPNLLSEASAVYAQKLGADVIAGLIRNYGSKYQEVTDMISNDDELGQCLGPTKVIKAEIIHAAREEMAVKMADAVFRRTDLGTAGHPGNEALESCLVLMAKELQWDEERKLQEYAEVKAAFDNLRNNATYQ